MKNFFIWFEEFFKKTFRIIRETLVPKPQNPAPKKEKGKRKKQFKINKISAPQVAVTETTIDITPPTIFDLNGVEIKKFDILAEEEIGLKNGAEFQSDSEGRFRSYGTTRPKVCPFCRTNEQITIDEQEGLQWRCKACDYTW